LCFGHIGTNLESGDVRDKPVSKALRVVLDAIAEAAQSREQHRLLQRAGR
jgi:hypothetical protein